MASNPKMEYQVSLCIFQNNSAMATLGLKEMGKLLWEGRAKGLPCWLSQIDFEKTRHGVQPQNGIPGFSLHSPYELSYGYLRFEGIFPFSSNLR